MRVNGYGVRPGNNGYSGQQRSGDEYNRSFKQIRFTSAEEYATRNVKEYHNYPEQKDLTKDKDDQKDKLKNKQNNAKNSGSSAAGGTQAIAQVVVALVGAAVVTVSYTSAVAKRAQKQVDDTSTSISQSVNQNQADDTDVALTATWEWGEDNETAVLILTDSTGKVVAEVPATISTSEEAAKCTTAGKMTYTATATYEGKSYSDTRDKELPALGHDFNSGTQTVLDNGNTATDFECNRCGEHFVVQNSANEE